MSIPIYLVAYAFLGVILSVVVVAIRAEDIGAVWPRAGILFAKLVIGSVVAIFMVEWLYQWTLLTYPVLVVLFAWLILGDRLWRRSRPGPKTP